MSCKQCKQCEEAAEGMRTMLALNDELRARVQLLGDGLQKAIEGLGIIVAMKPQNAWTVSAQTTLDELENILGAAGRALR